MKKLVLITVLALSVVVTACSGGSGTTSKGAATATTEPSATAGSDAGKDDNKQEEPIEVRIMSHFFGATPPSKDNAVELEIEKATNTKLNIEWNSAQNYQDKLNVVLASGDFPDLMLVPNTNPLQNAVFARAATEGAFWDVSPYIDDYPNIKNKIPATAWDLTKINGGNYVIPRPRPSEGESFFVLRKDWLDNVGLGMPTTSHELYEVLKAFTENDPDQNGKKDTVGFVGNVTEDGMGDFVHFESIFTGINGEWGEKNGELVFSAFLPEMRESIEYVTRAYKEGLIAQDFASLQLSQSKEIFSAGKAGARVEKTGAFQEYYNIFVENSPDFEFTNLYPVTNINGYNPKGPGFSGGNAIPKTVPEEKMKKILAMIDSWMEDDVFALHQGLEGTHYKVENGEKVFDSVQQQKDGVGEYNQIVYVADPYANTVKLTFPKEAQELYAQIQDERAKTGVASIGTSLVSEAGRTYLPGLRKDLTDLKIKIILGGESITAWDALIEKVKNDSKMQTVIAEIEEAYKNLKQ
jgi:putative aldouronate transport system substrate-binding protein